MVLDSFVLYSSIFLSAVLIGVFIFLIINGKNKSGFIERFNMKQNITKLVRQAARWSTAAKQDKNAMIAVLHANYGAGYLWALLDIATPEQIRVATGIDITKFQAEIVKTQDETTQRMAKLCPKYAPA